MLMADTVLIYADGHRAFKIDLSHSPTTVAELVLQAKMLRPGVPSSAATLSAYKEDRRARQRQPTHTPLPPPPAPPSSSAPHPSRQSLATLMATEAATTTQGVKQRLRGSRS